jgi:transcriptional regulator with XRE-family HTH domain
MSYGYSARLIEVNKKADARMLGVRLGRICVKHNVPVAKVAAKFRVSRQTVYNWFCGTHTPHPSLQNALSAFCDSVTSKN